MPVSPLYCIDAPLKTARAQLREAVLRLLAVHGWDHPPGRFDGTRCARVSGFDLSHTWGSADAFTRLGWDRAWIAAGASENATWHVLNVTIGDSVIDLKWWDGALSPRGSLKRGPWELELLRAAGMKENLPATLRIPPAFPLQSSHYSWPVERISGRKRDCLAHAVTFDIVSHRYCAPTVAPVSTMFADLVSLMDGCIAVAGKTDIPSASRTGVSSFTLRGWVGERPVRKGAAIGKPDFLYWVAPHGGARAAAALLVLLGRMAVRTPGMAATGGKGARAPVDHHPY